MNKKKKMEGAEVICTKTGPVWGKDAGRKAGQAIEDFENDGLNGELRVTRIGKTCWEITRFGDKETYSSKLLPERAYRFGARFARRTK